MLHHLDPRDRAAAIIGESVIEVLDGHRPPTPNERLTGILRGLDIGAYMHAIERDVDGRISSGCVAQMETEADMLALELVAPMKEVRKRLNNSYKQRNRDHISSILEDEFGIPSRAAAAWAQLIDARYRRKVSFSGWLNGDQ